MVWRNFEVKEQVKIERLYTLHRRHYDKGHRFLGEMHDFWEAVYVAEGEVVISADENIHHFKRGDIIFHKPLELHKFNVVGEDGATMLIFAFDMSGKLCESMERKAVHLDKYNRTIADKFLEYIEYKVGQCPSDEIKNYYGDILSFFKEDDIFFHTVALYISNIILSIASGASTLSKTKTHETELFKKALEIMNSRISETLSVTELASKLNMSVSSLKRLFDKYAGMSVHKYFLTLKIKAATVFLKEGMSVSEVSDVLGFSSQGYFSATYKRETGNNPSQI